MVRLRILPQGGASQATLALGFVIPPLRGEQYLNLDAAPRQ